MDHHTEHEGETEHGEESADTNPERQGPTSPGGPADPPMDPEGEQGPSGPPHESVPGDQGEAPNPKQ